MSFRKFMVSMVFLGILAAARAQSPESRPTDSRPADSPDPQKILEKARDVANALKGISYSAEFAADGSITSILPNQSGHVLLGRSTTKLIRVHADHWTTVPDGRVMLSEEFICNGVMVGSINHLRQQYRRLAGQEASSALIQWGAMFLQDLFRGSPYEKEIASESAVYKGSEVIDGVECDYIEVAIKDAPLTARWWLGKADSLPRRLQREIGQEAGGGKMTLKMEDVQANPPMTEDTFKFIPPEGYTERDPKSVSQAQQPLPWEAHFLPIGSEAPDWTLKTPDGKAVSLKDLRGKVVLLDFWATWCVPCRKVMPLLQKLHESYKDRPVSVIGVSTFERQGNPAQFMEVAGLTYGLLMNGDDVARKYLVRGIPTLYVIDPEGKIILAEAGNMHEDSIKTVIDNSLKSLLGSKEKSAPAAP